MSATIPDLSSLLKSAARQSPTDLKCRQLQAYRYLTEDYGVEVTAESMGATLCDKDGSYFWSRPWELDNFNPGKITTDFPALFMFEGPGTLKGAFNNRGTFTPTMEIAVIDAYKEGCQSGDCEGCDARTKADIFNDTQRLLSYALQYLGKSIYATVVTSTGSGQGLFHEPTLIALKEQGKILSYTMGYYWGAQFSAVQVNFFRVTFPAKNLYGTAVRFNVPLNQCETLEPSFVLPTLSVSGGENCCG